MPLLARCSRRMNTPLKTNGSMKNGRILKTGNKDIYGGVSGACGHRGD